MEHQREPLPAHQLPGTVMAFLLRQGEAPFSFEDFRVSKRQISAGSFISSDEPSVYSTFKITGVSMPPRLLSSTR